MGFNSGFKGLTSIEQQSRGLCLQNSVDCLRRQRYCGAQRQESCTASCPRPQSLRNTWISEYLMRIKNPVPVTVASHYVCSTWVMLFREINMHCEQNAVSVCQRLVRVTTVVRVYYCTLCLFKKDCFSFLLLLLFLLLLILLLLLLLLLLFPLLLLLLLLFSSCSFSFSLFFSSSFSFSFLRLFLLLLLTLQFYLGFGRLHQIIPGSSVFNELGPVSQFWNSSCFLWSFL